jgi:ADP-ribose pyrophosphatase YjhB (NUDIX family)
MRGGSDDWRPRRLRTRHTERVCGAGVILEMNSRRMVLVVLGRRSGKWGFPKGAGDGRETLAEVATRETFEETNVLVNITSRAATVSFSKRPARVYFMVDHDDVVAYGDASRRRDTPEVADARWMSVAELEQIPPERMNSALACYVRKRALSMHLVSVPHDFVPSSPPSADDGSPPAS